MIFDPTNLVGAVYSRTAVASSGQQIENVFYYPEQNYSLAIVVAAVIIPLVCLGWIGCLAALPTRKLAGLEIMCTMQYCWIAFLWFPNRVPIFMAYAVPLKYSSGYNYNENSGSDALESSPYWNLFDLNNAHLWENFNINMALYLLPLLLLVIFKVICMISQDPERKEKFKQLYEICWELLMYACVFNIQYLIVSSF